MCIWVAANRYACAYLPFYGRKRKRKKSNFSYYIRYLENNNHFILNKWLWPLFNASHRHKRTRTPNRNARAKKKKYFTVATFIRIYYELAFCNRFILKMDFQLLAFFARHTSHLLLLSFVCFHLAYIHLLASRRLYAIGKSVCIMRILSLSLSLFSSLVSVYEVCVCCVRTTNTYLVCTHCTRPIHMALEIAWFYVSLWEDTPKTLINSN